MADVDVETPAGQPKSATQDGTQVQQHSLPDLIKADQYVRSKAATRRSKWPLRHIQHVPPGTA